MDDRETPLGDQRGEVRRPAARRRMKRDDVAFAIVLLGSVVASTLLRLCPAPACIPVLPPRTHTVAPLVLLVCAAFFA